MCNWKKWIWPGILATLLLTAAATYFKSAFIEQDLTAKADGALSAQHNWASVKLDGRDATLMGIAPSEAAQATALKVADEAYDVRVIADASELLAIADPFKVSANKADGKIILEGNVADEADRASLIAMAEKAAPGAEIVDKMTFARGAPAGFAALAGYGIGQLTGLDTGMASLTNMDLTVKGAAPSSSVYQNVTNALTSLPEGGKLAMADITAPMASPYTLSAIKSADAVVLEGFYPTDALRASIVAAAENANPGKSVTDNMKFSLGAPEGFENLAQFGIGQLTGLSSGTATLSDLALGVKGVAPSNDVYNSVTDALGGTLPSGGSLALADITPPTADPYTFEAIKGSDSITLNGYVPSNATRSALVASANKAFPGKTVVDNMRLAIGEPNGFEALSTFGVGQLTTLETGKASTVNSDLSVKGIASSSKVYETVTGALNGELPGNGKLVMADISTPNASPYTFAAIKADDSITLTGHYPSSAVRAGIVAAAAKANPGKKIIDNLKFALGAPSGFADIAGFGVGQLGDFTSGSASISDADLSVKGLASTISSYNNANTQLGGKIPGAGKVVMADITPPSANPYVLTATENAKGVLLQGYVPNEATRARLVKAATAVSPSKKVTDQLLIASGAPAGFGDIANFGISQLGGLVSGEASLSNTDLSVRGVSINAASYNKVTSTLAGAVPSKGNVVLVDITRHSVSPYTFAATKAGNKINLSGFVETPEQRAAVVSSAKKQNPGAEVTDGLKIANGVPAKVTWPVATALAIREVSQLQNGSASLNNNMYSVEGLAMTKSKYDAVVSEANGQLPVGLKLAKEAVRRPDVKPYIWSFTNMENSAPTLSGYVPSADVNSANQGQIKAEVSALSALANTLQVGPGAPKGFAKATAIGIETVGDLKNGKASIVNSVLMVSGEAASGKEANRIRSRVSKGVPAGFIGKHDITFTIAAKPLPVLPKPAPKPKPKPKPKPIDLCKTALTDEMKSNKINFETNKAVIESSSHALLNRLVSALSFCPTAKVEIGGHTDSRGSAGYNQQLSEARANAVLNYLSSAGVNAARLSAVGYGEDQPIADNVTAEGLAANRRIEFIVNQ